MWCSVFRRHSQYGEDCHRNANTDMKQTPSCGLELLQKITATKQNNSDPKIKAESTKNESHQTQCVVHIPKAAYCAAFSGEDKYCITTPDRVEELFLQPKFTHSLRLPGYQQDRAMETTIHRKKPISTCSLSHSPPLNKHTPPTPALLGCRQWFKQINQLKIQKNPKRIIRVICFQQSTQSLQMMAHQTATSYIQCVRGSHET